MQQGTPPLAAERPSGDSKLFTLACAGFVLLLSFFTYLHNYHLPAAPYWDENYYITDAQRELHGVFSMQIHPPLGKLLIALGEALLHPNDRTDQFLTVEHAKEFPPEFSFAGYRLFPALLSWLTAIVLFGIFGKITRSSILATLLSFLYIFDNALIVHGRGAMLDGPLLFFGSLATLFFLLLLEHEGERRRVALLALCFGASVGLAVVTKFQGAIWAFLGLALLVHFRRNWPLACRFLVFSAAGFLIAFLGVWQIYFARGVAINPNLRNEGYFSASEEEKDILHEGRAGSVLAFPIMLRDALRYVPEYNRGIPKLDLCKSDENGSPFFLWPIGATAINYRWASADEGTYRYLYLQSNPIVWFTGIVGVLCGIALLLGRCFYPSPESPSSRDHLFLTATFLGMYVAYMAVMGLMDRVLFLPTYFPALLMSFVLFALAIAALKSVGPLRMTEERKIAGLMVWGLLLFASFQFFRPLTYYQPLSREQFERRKLLRIWNLHCVQCEKDSPLVRRQC